ncbi:MAG: endonuclease III [Candidatus Thorarchaeota archaeon]|jgi:endonuclease-3
MTSTVEAQEVIRLLEKEYPDAPPTYLNHKNAFEMLIATILSANTADACVNMITPRLFKMYPTPSALATAKLVDIVELIRRCGTYNKKSIYIQDTSKLIVERFSGEVPKSMENLVLFPGVSRKTANVVLSVVFGLNEGVVVDTHIRRVTTRLGLTVNKTPQKIEKDLMELLPRVEWYNYAKLIGTHGRRTCIARKPKCAVCVLNQICPSAELETP